MMDKTVPDELLEALREATDAAVDGDCNISVAELAKQFADLAVAAQSVVKAAEGAATEEPDICGICEQLVCACPRVPRLARSHSDLAVGQTIIPKFEDGWRKYPLVVGGKDLIGLPNIWTDTVKVVILEDAPTLSEDEEAWRQWERENPPPIPTASHIRKAAFMGGRGSCG